MNSDFKRRLLLLFLFLLGLIVPFFSELVLFEIFFLIPLLLLLVASIIISVVSFFSKKMKEEKVFIVLPVCVFIGAQIFSVTVASNYFRAKSNLEIIKIENHFNRFGNYPAAISEPLGIHYFSDGKSEFEIEYSRGFLVREIYTSSEKKWESFGWND